MKYSIIIPHYNSLKTVIKLLDSLLSWKETEIILVDDKSEISVQNELREKIKKYKNVLYLENNTKGKGAGCARNLGLKIAKGKWILFADADDFFLEGAFESIKKYENSDSDIIYFKVTSIFEDTGMEADRHWENNELIENYLANKKYSKELLCLNRVPWGKIIKKELLDKHNIRFEEVPAANDTMFSIKSNFYAKKIEISLEKIYCVSRNFGSITTVKSEKNFDSIFSQDILLDKFLQEIGKNKFRPSFIREIILSYRFGMRKVFFVFKVIKDNKLKLFTYDFYRRISLNYLKRYFKRKISQKKYLVR